MTRGSLGDREILSVGRFRFRSSLYLQMYILTPPNQLGLQLRIWLAHRGFVCTGWDGGVSRISRS
jgi:hypothetical protein